MKSVTLRKDPAHWLGMTLGAVAGLPVSWFAISRYLNEQNIQPRDAGGFWILLPLGAVVGSLLGRVISGVVYRLRDHSASEQELYEKEIQLHHQFAQGKPLYAYYTSVPETADLGALSLLTTQFLILAAMECEYCQAACDHVQKGGHPDSTELLSLVVLPNARSVEAIPLSAIRSVVVEAEVVKVTAFDDASGRDSSFEWPMPEGKEAFKQFTEKLKESLGCRRPLEEHKIRLNRQRRIHLSLAILGAITCLSLAVWCAISASGILFMLAFVLIFAFIFFVSVSEVIWGVRRKLVIYDNSLAASAKVMVTSVTDETLYEKFSRPLPKESPPEKVSWLVGLRWLLLFVCVVVALCFLTGEKMAFAFASLIIFLAPFTRKLLYKRSSRPTVKFSPPKLETAPCPYCGEPLRTSMAKQCPACKMDWHDPKSGPS